MFCRELNQVVTPYLLRDTLPVLSVGQRCMEQGYTFHWEAGRNPIMTNPEGLVVELQVDKIRITTRSTGDTGCADIPNGRSFCPIFGPG